MICTPTTHDVFRSLPSLWLSLHSIGVQKAYDEFGERDPSGDLAMSNCRCGSTLCIPLAQERRWMEEREQPKRVLDLMEYP